MVKVSMPSIDPRRFCEALYCAYAPVDAFASAASGRIAFTAHVTDRGRETAYRVEFTGVRAFTRKPDPTPESDEGDRLELSVLELEREAHNWRIWFNPWYLEEIEFRCDGISLDGAPVTGTGRWLQDSLPDTPVLLSVLTTVHLEP
jgi:hypothetical protein